MEEIFCTELGRKALALTKAGFKVSDLIPDLVLRERVKNHVLNFYKNFSLSGGVKNYRELINEIDILDHLFFLSGHLNLAKEEHVKSLRNGFLVFKSQIILLNNNAAEANKNTRAVQIGNDMPDRSDDLSAKQKRIMEKFNSKDTLKLAEILELFPNVSERTVRNELTSLIIIGKITRSGRGNGSFYKLLK